MRSVRKCVVLLAAVAAVSSGGAIAAAKLDKDTCDQLRAEQAGFVQTGVLASVQRGAEWGKANLSADKLREIERFILLDEQLKFGCREVTLTPEAMRAGEEALRLETNPDADPNAPAAPPVVPKTATDAASATAAPGADVTGAPAGENAPKRKTRARPHAKAKPAADAYVPPPGTESTLEPPAGAAPAPKAQ